MAVIENLYFNRLKTPQRQKLCLPLSPQPNIPYFQLSAWQKILQSRFVELKIIKQETGIVPGFLLGCRQTSEEGKKTHKS